MSRRRRRGARPRLRLVVSGSPIAPVEPAAALDWPAVNRALRAIRVTDALAACGADSTCCPVCQSELRFCPAGNRAWCSRCGASGTGLDMVRLARRISFRAAVRIVAPIVNLDGCAVLKAHNAHRDNAIPASRRRLLVSAERLVSDATEHPEALAILDEVTGLIEAARAIVATTSTMPREAERSA